MGKKEKMNITAATSTKKNPHGNGVVTNNNTDGYQTLSRITVHGRPYVPGPGEISSPVIHQAPDSVRPPTVTTGTTQKPRQREPPHRIPSRLRGNRARLARGTSDPAESLDFMQRGSFLVKVREKGKYRRFYKMESDFVTLHYHSKKNACSSPDTTLSVTDIQEIREGSLTDTFTKATKKMRVNVSKGREYHNNDRCFSLVYGEKHKTLDLVADTNEVRASWVHGLKHIKKKLSDADLSTKQTVWMRELFKMADKDGDSTLTLKEILTLLKHLNISVDYDTAKQVFDDEQEDWEAYQLEWERQQEDGRQRKLLKQEHRKQSQGHTQGQSQQGEQHEQTEGQTQLQQGEHTEEHRKKTQQGDNQQQQQQQPLPQQEEQQQTSKETPKDHQSQQQKQQQQSLPPVVTLAPPDPLELDDLSFIDDSDADDDEAPLIVRDVETLRMLKIIGADVVPDPADDADDEEDVFFDDDHQRLIPKHPQTVSKEQQPQNETDVDERQEIRQQQQPVERMECKQQQNPQEVQQQPQCTNNVKTKPAEFADVLKVNDIVPENIPNPEDVTAKARTSSNTSETNSAIEEYERYYREKRYMKKSARYGDDDDEDDSSDDDVDSEDIFARYVIELLKSADADRAKNRKGDFCLDMDEFISFYKILTSRNEIEDLFQKYNYEGQYLEADELRDLINIEQKLDLTLDQCEKLIQEHEPCPKIKDVGAMGIDGFYSLFASPMFDVFNYKHREIYQDMDQPLNQYYIDSSHNTYLTADQLMGDSAVEAYIRALKAGCRCVELDCWDGDKGEPVIYHGHTFTSKIMFKDVIKAVNSYAFEASEYAVILSLENHCSIEQQQIMAKQLKKILGDKLYTTPLPDSATCLPSPNDLKGKVVLKGKKLPAPSGVAGDDEVSDEDEAADISNEDVQIKVKATKSKKKLKLARELSDLVVICQSKSFKGFDAKVAQEQFVKMSSIAESKAMSLAEDSSQSFIQHNRWQLTRNYPAGMRTDSSNYSPMPLWLVGCQIVALNYQTNDDPMVMNRGQFEDNGGCGYVLKPRFLREPGEDFYPSGPFPDKWTKKIRLQVISGYQLPKKRGDKARSILDPYVRVDIMGVEADNRSVKTNYIKNNGFHPIWNESFDFEVKVPEVALIKFQVLDYQDYRSNVMVAQYCMPVTSLMSGYRFVHMKSKYGEKIRGANLFIHVTIT